MPFIGVLGALLLFPHLFANIVSTSYRAGFMIGRIAPSMFFRDATRIWGWKLKILPECIHVRRDFRWSTIPWHQFHSVENARSGGRSESMNTKRTSHCTDRLGSFNVPFARRL